MSKYVKNLVIEDIQRRLKGVNDALVVNVIGLDSGKTFLLRRKLREKKINVFVVKNSLAKRATEGTKLGPAFETVEGSMAVCWGSEDFVSLVKEIVAIGKTGEFEKFETRGGVLDGEKLTADKVKQISKWPNRQEQLSILLGQILAPGANLLSQLNSPGGALLSQLKEIEKKQEETKQEETKQEEPAAS
jgi:large subunit ribosomal protein L10